MYASLLLSYKVSEMKTYFLKGQPYNTASTPQKLLSSIGITIVYFPCVVESAIPFLFDNTITCRFSLLPYHTPILCYRTAYTT